MKAQSEKKTMPQKLGQHFLKNQAALRFIADALELNAGETVIEIGPGHGELTKELGIEDLGLQVMAIERDAKLATDLNLKFKNDIKVIHQDALKFLKSLPQSSILKTQSFKLVGNIPYYITGHLLRIISELEYKPELCVFTIQKEVAERITAKPPHMNRLAASVQFWADPKILKTLPASDFNPPPKVDSAVILLRATEQRTENGEWNTEKYYTTVRTLFAQPRKTILNNLTTRHSPLATREKIENVLKKLEIDPTLRPQNLSLDEIKAISALTN